MKNCWIRTDDIKNEGRSSLACGAAYDLGSSYVTRGTAKCRLIWFSLFDARLDGP